MSKDVETDRDGGEKSFRDVSDDDADEKNDGVEPEVSENEGNDEEGNAEKDGDGGNDVNEVWDLASYRRLDGLQTAGEDRDSSHHGPITRVDHHATTRTYQCDAAIDMSPASESKRWQWCQLANDGDRITLKFFHSPSSPDGGKTYFLKFVVV